MKHIHNRRKADCGICAVAMFLETSWKDAASKIFPGTWKRKRRFGTKTKDLYKGIKSYCYVTPYKLKPVKNWEDIPYTTIVKVWKKAMGKNWHWVVWNKEENKVYDNCADIPVDPVQYFKKSKNKLMSYMRMESN